MSQVRRCAACGDPGAVVIREWGTTGVLSGPTGRVSRTDFRCQSCGARFRLLPWHAVRAVVGGFVFGQLALLFAFVAFSGLLALFESTVMGLGLGLFGLVGAGISGLGFGWSVSSSWYAFRNPVLPNAPMPPLRFGEEPEHRSCTCGKPAPASRTIAHTTNGVPTGTETFFACTCGEEFSTEDVWGLCFNVMVGTVLLPIGLVLYPEAVADPGWWSIGLAAVFLLGGVGAYSMTGFGLFRRFVRHPRVEISPSTPGAGS